MAQAAGDLARKLADGPQVAMRLLKRSIYNAAEPTFEQSCDGVASFVEKRKPKFNARLHNQRASMGKI